MSGSYHSVTPELRTKKIEQIKQIIDKLAQF